MKAPDRVALREAVEWSIKALSKFADWSDDRGLDATLAHPEGKISTALLVRPRVEEVSQTLRAWLDSGLSDDEPMPTLVLLRQRTNELGNMHAALRKVREEMQLNWTEGQKHGASWWRNGLERGIAAIDSILEGGDRPA